MPPMLSTAVASAAGRRAAMLPAASVEVLASAAPDQAGSGAQASRTHISQITGGAAADLPPLPRRRARGIGSRFAAPQPPSGSAGRAGGMIR
jgi:hypothetical protein